MRTLLAVIGIAVAACSARADSRGTQSNAGNTTQESQKPEGKMNDTTQNKPDKAELKDKLSPEQYYVTQECGTEPPFKNAYWNNHAAGIYVDVVSGEALFSSLDKFDSGTGWPSFTKPLDASNIVERSDTAHGMTRVEIRSKHADSHLGHVFEDGPAPSGQRFCMNSASLRFIPAEHLVAEGYGQYAKLFPNVKQAGASTDTKDPKAKPAAQRETAIFAGGCFWGMEELLRKIPGVIDTEVGYTGGKLDKPTYEDVKTGRTGHAESVRIVYDPSKTSYETLLSFFFRMHDPTTMNRQGNDVGTQYRSAIFYTSDEQRRIAEEVKERVNRSGKWKAPVVTQIVPAGEFYRAEDYHQDYLEIHPNGYTCHFLRD